LSVNEYLLLRTAVASLGELVNPPWWRTQFLTEAGTRMTLRLFPRTGHLAAVRSTSLAARAEHDKWVGAGRFHLFRLPEALEAVPASEEAEPLSSLIGQPRESLIEVLRDWSAGAKVPEGEGPVLMGPVTLLDRPDTLKRLSALYLTAFLGSKRVYPFFEPPAAELGRMTT
jgi:hypothetical protein